MNKEPIELLAPARDLRCGIAAIDHGADAVYVGANRFGARTAAGNSIADIERLCKHAHLFAARVYLTLNTILYDDELHPARQLVLDAWNAGIDGIIIQDMALLEMDLPPVPLHASTQMNNIKPEHVRFLEAAGISRVVLARELDINAIREIRESTATIGLEAFVHGALCVSYSGRCWMSCAMGGRSANRGACGQPCRLNWDLLDTKGHTIATNRHLLSLKDMDRSAYLEQMLDAGISAFKIEGRLKDIAYVKNLTAFYRRSLDKILEKRAGCKQSSEGIITHHFIPDPKKTFHRGATEYFIDGKRSEIWNFDTPKAVGEQIGTVLHVDKNSFTLKEKTDLANGDGICWFDSNRKLHGTQINRVSAGKIFPAAFRNLKKAPLKTGTVIYRNLDHQFKKTLEGHTADRKIPVAIRFTETREEFLLEMEDQLGNCAVIRELIERVPANRPESVRGIVERQVSKLGDTPFSATEVNVKTGPWFFRSSTLNRMRRLGTEHLHNLRLEKRVRPLRRPPSPGFATLPYPVEEITAEYNVANSLSEKFYRTHGARTIHRAFERAPDNTDHPLMTSKHCLRYALESCPRYHGVTDSGDWILTRHEKRFRVSFDCKHCRMQIRLDAPEK